MLNLLNNIRF